MVCSQRLRTWRRGVALAALVALSACSDGAGSDTGSSTTADVSTSAPVDGSVASDVTVVDEVVPPIVEQITAAVAAVEGELGGPQEYFEINATPALINLFVALNDGALAQPWLYAQGVASSSEALPVQSGGTFTADLLDFDPATIFAKIEAEVPGATIESFYVNGDGLGNVLYGAFVTSARGGALEIILGPDGAVKSVDPVN
jgi:hypothetical protein